METFLFIVNLIGTVAFAAAGAVTGLQKNMDIFGVCVLGLTTAVGGGIVRDLILGITPPNAVSGPLCRHGGDLRLGGLLPAALPALHHAASGAL